MSGRAINRVLIVPGGAGGTGGNTGTISAGTAAATLGEVVFADSNGVTFGVDGQTVTASVGAGGSVNFSAGTASANLTAVVFSNSNGVSFGLNGSTITATVQTNYLTTAMASNRGSDFVQATAVFNGTNASGTIASNAISVSVGNYITTAMASNRGSDFVQATAVFNGTNASGTIASNAISVSVGNYLTSQSNQAASASNGSFTFQTLGFSNANNVTFGTSAGSIVTASVAAGGGGERQTWIPVNGTVPLVANGIFNASQFFYALPADGGEIDRALAMMTVSQSSSSNSSYNISLTFAAGIYTLTGSTLSLATSGSKLISWNVTSNDTTANQAGIRFITAPLSATFDGDAWLGVVLRSSTAGANWASLSAYFGTGINAGVSGYLAQASTNSAQFIPGWGVWTATTDQVPGSAAISDLFVTGNVPNRFPMIVHLLGGTI